MYENESNNSWIIGLLVVAALAAGAYFYLSGDRHKKPAPAVIPQTEEVTPEPELEIEEPAPAEPEPSTEPARELPALDASDESVRADLLSLSADGALAKWLVDDELIRKWVAAVSAASRGELITKNRPLKEIKDPFKVAGNRDSGFELSDESYQRYDQLVRLFALVNTEQALSFYKFWYPRLAQAYGELGIKNKNFHQVVLEAIDKALAAPQIEGPIKLVRPKVYYKFADPELEKLPGIHRLMIRMGPDNAARVKEKLEELKVALKQVSS
jgi:hypothetical protein